MAVDRSPEELQPPEEMQRAISERLKAMTSFNGEMAAIRGQASAADGLVTVTVTTAGRLTELQLDPRAMRLPSQHLAEHILSAIDAAAAQATERMRDAAEAAFGGGGATWEELIVGDRDVDLSAPLPGMPDLATFDSAVEAQARMTWARNETRGA